LRSAFSDTHTPVEYKYSDVEEDSNIAIYREFPKRIMKYPCLVVESEAADAKMMSLGEEEVKENRDESNNLLSVVYGGGLTIPITITILAKTTTDRERITDLVTIFLRYLFRNKFYQYGFNYTHVSIGGERQEDIDNETIFTNTVTTNMYTEYENTLDASYFQTINKLTIDIDIPLTV
jgi:hypothetical protein